MSLHQGSATPSREEKRRERAKRIAAIQALIEPPKLSVEIADLASIDFDFESRLQSMVKSLIQTGLLERLKEHSFSSEDLAKAEMQLLQVAIEATSKSMDMQIAHAKAQIELQMSIKELDLKHQELFLQDKKMKYEMEILELNISKQELEEDILELNKKKNKAEIEVLVRTTLDNSRINMANGIVQLVNVVSNASRKIPTPLVQEATRCLRLMRGNWIKISDYIEGGERTTSQIKQDIEKETNQSGADFIGLTNNQISEIQ